MKTSINKLCIAASILVTAAGISACVDDNKTLYDPEYKTPNPMEEISAPTDLTGRRPMPLNSM